MNEGDVVKFDLGVPAGSEAAAERPCIIVTPTDFIRSDLVHIVPMTSTIRNYWREITIEPTEINGLKVTSAIQTQHLRSLSPARFLEHWGVVDEDQVAAIRDLLKTQLGFD